MKTSEEAARPQNSGRSLIKDSVQMKKDGDEMINYGRRQWSGCWSGCGARLTQLHQTKPHSILKGAVNNGTFLKPQISLYSVVKYFFNTFLSGHI